MSDDIFSALGRRRRRAAKQLFGFAFSLFLVVVGLLGMTDGVGPFLAGLLLVWGILGAVEFLYGR